MYDSLTTGRDSWIQTNTALPTSAQFYLFIPLQSSGKDRRNELSDCALHRSSPAFFCCCCYCCSLLVFSFTTDSVSRKAAPHADTQLGCSRLGDKSAAVQALEPRGDEEVRSLPLCLAISLARISTFSRLLSSSCAKVSITQMRERGRAEQEDAAVGRASSFGEIRICQRHGKTNRGPAGRRSITAVSQG